jgi:hypothetical protein
MKSAAELFFYMWNSITAHWWNDTSLTAILLQWTTSIGA